MRLWHKDLIRVLPAQQLKGQWRECCAIAKSIAENGTPNHMLVNKVIKFPLKHFYSYTKLVYDEMKKRGYNPNKNNFLKWVSGTTQIPVNQRDLFYNWHNSRYLMQCYYNLQEKYDCGGITDEEWEKIYDVVQNIKIEV